LNWIFWNPSIISEMGRITEASISSPLKIASIVCSYPRQVPALQNLTFRPASPRISMTIGISFKPHQLLPFAFQTLVVVEIKRRIRGHRPFKPKRRQPRLAGMAQGADLEDRAKPFIG